MEIVGLINDSAWGGVGGGGSSDCLFLCGPCFDFLSQRGESKALPSQSSRS